MENLSAEEMERQLGERTKAFEEHIRKVEQEILDEIDSEIKELTRISKEDDLGF